MSAQNTTSLTPANTSERETARPTAPSPQAASVTQLKRRLAETPDFDAQVQMLAPGAQGGDHVHKAAAHGTSGAGGALPFGDRIQKSFGSHDLSGVKAHTGTEAKSASAAMGADAFATGNHMAFGGAPDLHTAAHEAAHVGQQRGGVALSGGVGEKGDRYEQHADAVADAVVAGKSAEPLLSEMAGGGGGSGETVQKADKDGGGGWLGAIGKFFGFGSDKDKTEETEPEVDPELTAFLNQGVFGPQDLQAPTGLGGFEALYDVNCGQLQITIRGSVGFVNGLDDVGGVVMANSPDLQEAADAANTLADPADRALFLADFTWGADTATWLQKMTANVEKAWSNQYTFFVDRPGWEEVGATVDVKTNISADMMQASDHVHVSVYKVPDDGWYDVGAVVNSGPNAFGNSMVLSSRDNRDAADREAEGDLGLLNWSIGSFAVNSAVLTPDMQADVTTFCANFLDANNDNSNPVTLTGRASSDGDKAGNEALAKKRAEAVAEALKAGGVANVRLTVEVAGEAGATADPEWRRVDLKVGDGRAQDVAAHEFGHVLGLGDYYDNAGNGRGGSISGTGQPAGTVTAHDQLAKDIGISGGAVHENNDGLMSLGTNVKPADYSTVGWALQTVTGRPEWRIKG